MASPALTIRNFTVYPITLKHISRFQDPNSRQSNASVFSFGPKNSTSPAPAASALGEHAKSYRDEEVDVRLLAFEAYTIPSTTSDSDDNPQIGTTTIRLTLETHDGVRHRIDINPSYTQKASRPLTPLSPNPSITLSSLYHPANTISHLTIHTHHSYDLSKWMSHLPSTLPLSALSIPGTHNSHTHYRALPSVRCQVVDLKTQLSHGIRFLDIRVQPAHATDVSKKDLYLVHGAFPISLTGPKYLAPLLETCYSFLDENPGETILISLKREGVGNATDEHLSRVLERHYFRPNRSKWYFPPLADPGSPEGIRIPYLGDVRGKLVLLRRYTAHSEEPPSSSPPSPSPSPSSSQPTHPHPPPPPTLPSLPGLAATHWPHNATHSPPTPTFPISLQDYCDILHPASIPLKLSHATSHIARCAANTAFVPGVNTDEKNPCPPHALYLNFLSGSNFWRRELAKQDRGNEIGLIRRASPKGDMSTGVIIMDNVGEGGDWDLVRLIVGCNMGVLMKMGIVGAGGNGNGTKDN
ncbi:PLC-like phosphodiesterase [Westerdykella ornata]|uniref:PLC-like phosphodiesterase n=1 Tax=Westerdykella ornata TaxID=318751 RepID=A0A6A6J6E9_WESOR|nr:PLC-like phosphodiesterase [Westerdykella ornata]KAF2271538.1 PLC-like phosphodiesterase [Westerdykella ornata]